MKFRVFSLLLFQIVTLAQATESPSWVDFTRGQILGTSTVLRDFSYAGYHFSEKELPDTSSWLQIDVTNYGATPNDSVYDDSGIHAAIDAAEAANEPVVINFPAGKYLVSDMANRNNPFIIRKSHIVLKGAGSGEGGTEIFTENTGSENASGVPQGGGEWHFQFVGPEASENEITTIVHAVEKGTFEVQVADASNLSVGQAILIYHQSLETLDLNMPGLTYKTVWNTGKRGIRTFEKHLIEGISGNFVTFKNPIQLSLPGDSADIEIRPYSTIEEVGMEGFLLTSGWADYPVAYKHHLDNIVDYGWRAVSFERVQNAWILDCDLKDWNEGMQIEQSMAVTARDLRTTGKQGHTSYFARYSYGVLFENCRDDANHGHGPGMRWSTVNTVYLNCKMNTHQSVDCHGYHPYSNLLDNVYGGSIRANGGAESSYPNSGPDLTFWNFIHASDYSNKEFDFWDPVDRKLYTYPNPIFVGFQAPGENITFKNAGLDELNGQMVYPKSLFEAQLQFRLFDTFVSASSEAEDHRAVLANDGRTETYWQSEDEGLDAWVQIDLGIEQDIDGIILGETGDSITSFDIEKWTGLSWEGISTGTTVGKTKSIQFPTQNLRRLRVRITSTAKAKQSVAINTLEPIYKNGAPHGTAKVSSMSEKDLGRSTTNGSHQLKANLLIEYEGPITAQNLKFNIGTLSQQIEYYNATNADGEILSLTVEDSFTESFKTDWLVSTYDRSDAVQSENYLKVSGIESKLDKVQNPDYADIPRTYLKFQITDTGVHLDNQLSSLALSLGSGSITPISDARGTDSILGQIVLVDLNNWQALETSPGKRPFYLASRSLKTKNISRKIDSIEFRTPYTDNHSLLVSEDLSVWEPHTTSSTEQEDDQLIFKVPLPEQTIFFRPVTEEQSSIFPDYGFKNSN